MMKDMTLGEFTSALASDEPVPGGGGASALAGALAACLGGMVASLTIGKKKYASVEGEMRELQDALAAEREKLLALIDGDAEAFAPLAAAYRMPSDTEARRGEKEAAVERALGIASGAPLEIMRACSRISKLLAPAAQKGSRLAVSDAGAAGALCAAAMRAASLNVYINAAAMKDILRARELTKEADSLLAFGAAEADGVYQDVLRSLRGDDKTEAQKS